jgi:hypothetical protein
MSRSRIQQIRNSLKRSERHSSNRKSRHSAQKRLNAEKRLVKTEADRKALAAQDARYEAYRGIISSRVSFLDIPDEQRTSLITDVTGAIEQRLFYFFPYHEMHKELKDEMRCECKDMRSQYSHYTSLCYDFIGDIHDTNLCALCLNASYWKVWFDIYNILDSFMLYPTKVHSMGIDYDCAEDKLIEIAYPQYMKICKIMRVGKFSYYS